MERTKKTFDMTSCRLSLNDGRMETFSCFAYQVCMSSVESSQLYCVSKFIFSKRLDYLNAGILNIPGRARQREHKITPLALFTVFVNETKCSSGLRHDATP